MRLLIFVVITFICYNIFDCAPVVEDETTTSVAENQVEVCLMFSIKILLT